MATHKEEIVNSMRKRVVELHNGDIVRDQAQGVYDSAEYFPDSQVEAKAQQARAEAHIAPAESIAVLSAARDRKERLANAQSVVDTVNQLLASDVSDAGIERLAKNVHTGKTGRYGEAFTPVEETLTWGSGLTLEELAQQEAKQQEAQAETPEDAKSSEGTASSETAPAAPPAPPIPPRPKHKGAHAAPPAPPTPLKTNHTPDPQETQQ